MDASGAREAMAAAQERMRLENAEAFERRQLLEQEHRDAVTAEVAATRELIDAEIIKAAQEGKAHAMYEYRIRIAASRNSPEAVTEIKTHASEVISSIISLLLAEGFSQERGEPRDERDLRDGVDALPEYHVIPLRVSWPRLDG